MTFKAKMDELSGNFKGTVRVYIYFNSALFHSWGVKVKIQAKIKYKVDI